MTPASSYMFLNKGIQLISALALPRSSQLYFWMLEVSNLRPYSRIFNVFLILAEQNVEMLWKIRQGLELEHII